jgi:hypothetical protein
MPFRRCHAEHKASQDGQLTRHHLQEQQQRTRLMLQAVQTASVRLEAGYCSSRGLIFCKNRLRRLGHLSILLASRHFAFH